MKNKLSYKSKRRIIVATAALAVFATSVTGTYMYIKGNNESEAAEANQQVIAPDGGKGSCKKYRCEQCR